MVDDDALLCRVVERVLETEGFEVLVANDGFGALATLADRHVDLVLLDIRMPGLDGLRVLEMITLKNGGPPVVMMTGHAHVDSAQKAKLMGARDYIGKPFGMDEIRRAVSEALRLPRRPRLRESERASCEGLS